MDYHCSNNCENVKFEYDEKRQKLFVMIYYAKQNRPFFNKSSCKVHNFPSVSVYL